MVCRNAPISTTMDFEGHFLCSKAKSHTSENIARISKDKFTQIKTLTSRGLHRL